MTKAIGTPPKRARSGPGSVLLLQDYINEYLGILKDCTVTLTGQGKGMIRFIG